MAHRTQPSYEPLADPPGSEARQLATGEPDAGYPFRWSVHMWIEGEPVSRAPVGGLAALAEDLAAWLAALGDEIDVGAALAAWEDARRAERGSRPPVWFDGDLLPANLLARDGRLAAVLDFAGLGVCDPPPLAGVARM